MYVGMWKRQEGEAGGEQDHQTLDETVGVIVPKFPLLSYFLPWEIKKDLDGREWLSIFLLTASLVQDTY